MGQIISRPEGVERVYVNAYWRGVPILLFTGEARAGPTEHSARNAKVVLGSGELDRSSGSGIFASWCCYEVLALRYGPAMETQCTDVIGRLAALFLLPAVLGEG